VTGGKARVTFGEGANRSGAVHYLAQMARAKAKHMKDAYAELAKEVGGREATAKEMAVARREVKYLESQIEEALAVLKKAGLK